MTTPFTVRKASLLMVGYLRKLLLTRKVNQKIRFVSSSYGDEAEFERRALEVGKAMSPAELAVMPSALRWGLFRAPWGVRKSFSGMFDWMDAQFAGTFAIFYTAGAASIDPLWTILRQDYDWHHGQALRVLAGVATKDPRQEQVAEEIVRLLPDWPYELVLGGMAGMASLSQNSEVMANALLSLVDEWYESDPIEALEILGPLCGNAPQIARQRLPLLRQVMREHGRGVPRSPLADGQVVVEGNKVAASGGYEYPSVPDLHAVRAATFIHKLDPQDTEALRELERWSREHPDEGLRQEVLQLLDSQT